MIEGRPLGTALPTIVARQHVRSSSTDRCMTQGGVCPAVKFLGSLADSIVLAVIATTATPTVHLVTSTASPPVFLKNSLESKLLSGYLHCKCII